MRWREAINPVAMERVAVLAPRSALRDALVVLGDAGTVEIDPGAAAEPVVPGSAAARLQRLPVRPAAPSLSAVSPDLDRCEAQGRTDLIAGEAELEERASRALAEGRVVALVG